MEIDETITFYPEQELGAPAARITRLGAFYSIMVCDKVVVHLYTLS